jgi:hypothetical protein
MSTTIFILGKFFIQFPVVHDQTFWSDLFGQIKFDRQQRA